MNHTELFKKNPSLKNEYDFSNAQKNPYVMGIGAKIYSTVCRLTRWYRFFLRK